MMNHLRLNRPSTLYRVGSGLVVLASAFLTFYLWGPGLDAGWWVIDDHEIHWFIGRDDRMPPQQFLPNLLEKTEVGDPVELGRFRPGYYGLRLLECMIWGKNPTLWYASRMLLFFASLSIFLLLLSRLVGPLLALPTTLLIVGDIYWADIFARLGPAETYAVFGLALYALGFAEAHRALRSSNPAGFRPALWVSALLVGSFMAAGSKENFTLLALPSAFLFSLGVRWSQQRISQHPILLAGLGVNVLIPVSIAAVVVRAVVMRGADVYQNPVSPGERLGLLVDFIGSGDWRSLLLTGLALLSVVLVAVTRRSIRDQDRRQLLVRAMWLHLVLLAIYLSQYVFYNGAWPNHTRYDFPGLLVPYIALAHALCTAIRLIPAGARTGALVVSVAGLLMWGIGERHDIRKLRKLSVRNREQTEAFAARIDRIVAAVSQSPRTVVLLQAYDPRDYEPAGSVARFLYTRGVDNPLQLHVSGVEQSMYAPTTLEHAVVGFMERWMRDGDPEYALVPRSRPEGDHFTIELSAASRGRGSRNARVFSIHD